MTIAAGGNSGQSYAEINMTPLIDVMLVLLIIFIITLPRMTNAVKIDNPINPHPHPTEEFIALDIDFDGQILWNGTPVDRPALRNHVSVEAAKSPQPEVHLRVDKFARYEVVAQTLADLQLRGLSKIGFVNP
jgi:biopolymer transport protein ExbD